MPRCSKIHKVATTSILNILEDCTPNNLRKLGLSDELVAQLSELDLEGRRFISEKSSNFLQLEFNPNALAQQLIEFDKSRCLQDIEDQFLLLNAPSKMMNQLFGIHSNEFCERRKKLNLSGGQHRHSYCDEKTESTIWKYWKENENIDERNRYLKVAELSNQNLNIVWQAIKRYNEG